MAEEKGTCFVVCPIGAPDSDIRKRSDAIFAAIIEPAVKRCGYKAIRADQIEEAGNISEQIIDHLLNAPMVIADLSGHNPNVFYELAIRHAVRKPIVQLMQDGEKIPFDVSQLRTISIDDKDIASVRSAEESIVAQIAKLEESPESLRTPISAAIDIEAMKAGDSLSDRVILQIHDDVTAMRVQLEKMDNQARLRGAFRKFATLATPQTALKDKEQGLLTDEQTMAT